MDMKVVQKALDRAKIQLMSTPDSAFFTTVCFSLRHVWDDSIPTAMTNGLEIRFNPDFFMCLSEQERVFLLLHEVGHVIFLHCTPRIGNRCPDKWNIAGDYVINGMLKERGFHMPKGGLYDAQYSGMSTEQVYATLPDNPGMPLPMQDVVIGPMPGNQADPNGGQGGQAPLTPQEIEARITDILVRATLQSKLQGDKPGTIPGAVEIFLDRLLNPKLPWYTLLRRFLNDRIKDDYSWAKPNRRFFPDLYLPSLYSEGLSHIAFAVDTSGSVSDSDFQRFISEIAGVLRQFKPSRMTLIQFDTRIKSVDEIASVDDLMRVKFTGRGGTRIGEVLDWAEQEQPQALLVFTDGEFRQETRRLKSPLVWLIHDNPRFVASMGKTIHYSIGD